MERLLSSENYLFLIVDKFIVYVLVCQINMRINKLNNVGENYHIKILLLLLLLKMNKFEMINHFIELFDFDFF
jgi:hypothetical protein